MDDSNQHSPSSSSTTATAAAAAAAAAATSSPASSNFSSSYQYYSKLLRKRFTGFIPSLSDLKFPEKITFLENVSSLFKRTVVPSTSRRRRGNCLPLPLPSGALESFKLTPDAARVYEVLGDISEHIFFNLHSVEKNLQFWQARAEGSTSQKVYFMVFERGPRAFLDGSGQLLHDYLFHGTGMQSLSSTASAHISERISVLTSLRYSLATFLAQVYVEVDKVGEQILKEPEKSLTSLLSTVNVLFLDLETSIGHVSAIRQTGSSVDGSYSSPLLFEKLPGINQQGSQWTDCAIRDTINLIYLNLGKLDVYLSLLVAKHQKPRKMTQHWVRYTVGAVGITVFSLWLLRHSRLAGSSDIDNWILDAKESVTAFMTDHVEQPLLAIRDELFETFRQRHRGMMELEEVQLTSNSLHRMLLAFSEQTKGQKFPPNASDQEMLEIVMGRYEKELMHPIQNLLGGELARAMLIQIQKLKLDIETAMLELNQILRANEINFAILAALPAFFLSLVVLMLLRAWVKQDTRAEGKGRIARVQRRLLIVEVEKKIMQFQSRIDQGLEKDAQCMYGLVLYTLDRLYRAVERHAKSTGEWQCLRQDISDLGKPNLQTAHKLMVTSRMERMYDCLLPSTRR
ncbi:putative nuclear control of ATP synthase 2 [Helianthus annuus]|uniref:Nuclear control of ATP synthase 2 n=1 Tax=Helianthus annuus TaxID=4232 RepID=A0A251UQV9_HELAN|nr:protein DGS1, mitochondrial [Helianthus annuus]KAF5756534.1 putative nuclear control of ATP synthase 2 [Helianthus annuus]KAJ0430035.1 putative nuclear control of ATP synthase 2 [Helianthus annuus]KAJ0668587.1 putative nuclear control of ATP synthase 2 [Helianthus annuus]